MTLSDHVDKSVFATRRRDAASNFEAARAFTSPFFDLAPTKDTFADTWASCTSYLMDTLVFEQSSFGPMSLTRNATKRYDPARETVAVWMVESGFHSGVADDATFRSRPGEIHLLDSRCALQIIASRRKISTVHLPYASVGYDPSCHSPHLCLPADGPKGACLSNSLTSVFSRLPSMSFVQAGAVAAEVSALVRAAFDLGPVTDPVSTERARKNAARTWLNARLDDLSLDATSLCQAFDLSRSTVYRMFQSDGGVQAYLRGKRLEEAFLHLSTAPIKRGDIRKVAERWGFDDPSHFNRIFRQQFQCAPSDVPPLNRADKLELEQTTNTLNNPVFAWLNENHRAKSAA